MTYKRVLIAADDALSSAAASKTRETFRKVDKKFRKAVRLLCGFEKDFSSKYQNIGGTVSGKAKMNDKSEYALSILSALKKNLHAKVRFLSASLALNADRS
jgi:hypothetical protein